MKKVCIFDIHNVLMYGNFSRAYTRVAPQIGTTPDVLITYFHNNLKAMLVGDITTSDIKDAFSADMSGQDFANVFKQELLSEFTLNAEVLNIINRLRKSYTLVALSNITDIRKVLDVELGVHSYFDYALLSCDVGRKKPDKQFFQMALDVTNATAEECIFIDDQKRHTDVAEQMGIDSIVFTDAHSLKANLQSRFGISV